MLVVLLLTVAVIWLTHYLCTYSFNYWKKRGVPGPEPTMLVGNIGSSLFMKENAGLTYAKWYREYRNYIYVGFFNLLTPSLMIRDPDLIKDIVIKDFQSFHDNDSFLSEETDPLLARNPIFLKGHLWKLIRSQITGGITTGKLKNMFPLMVNVGQELSKYIKNSTQARSKDGLETKDLSEKFTTDVVASCAFGLDGRSFKEDDPEFRRMGKRIFAVDTWSALKFTLLFMAPRIMKFFGISFVEKDVQDWFTGILKETIKYREENNIVRHDYLDLLLNLKKKSGEYVFTDKDVMCQAMTFYADGYETSSVALSFALYEIAKNTDVQEKLREEIDAKLKETGGEITYDAVMSMNYLDMVLSECLRKYPPAVFLIRVSTKPYMLPSPNGDEFAPKVPIEKNVRIVLPVYAIHHDPTYYPNPENFCPERFTDEEKNKRPKCTYMPFGEGPRQCLGFRFALSQIKAAIVSVVSELELKLNPKTPNKIEVDPKMLIITPKGGLWVNFYPRSK